MGCIVQIILVLIAFAIHPVFGIIWLIAQVADALNDDDETHG
jgi:hypothetical protein